jgi:TRAP-type C4-dicarboxylate transport system substrate-binding protein
MDRSRALAGMLFAAMLFCAASPAGAAAADQPLTLRLITPEDEGRPSEAFLQAFKAAITTDSAGSMNVEVTYHAGGDDPSPKEAIAAERVMAGEVEMGVIPVRAWNDVGVTSLQALATPFLIHDDALAIAATSDPLLDPMIADAATAGIVALAVWPEDLRHPFTFQRNGDPMVSPADFTGVNFWVLPYQLQTEAIETLGAHPVNGNVDAMVMDGSLRGSESGLWTGAYNLPGMPVATSDVTFYPKIQVLAMEDSAWSRLTPDQQAIVRDAAAKARATYLSQRPGEIALGQAWCAAGGVIVHAGPEAIAAFAAAERPVYERMAMDPVAGPAVQAIMALQATIPPAGTAITCEPKVDANATIPPVEPGPDTTLLPDGTYVHTRTKSQLVDLGTGELFAANNAGDWTFVISGDTGHWILKHPDGQVETCNVEFSLVDGDRIRMENQGSCGPYWTEFRWSLEGDQLTITAVDEAAGTVIELLRSSSWLSGPWTKVE